jgi:hypothetical protein
VNELRFKNASLNQGNVDATDPHTLDRSQLRYSRGLSPSPHSMPLSSPNVPGLWDPAIAILNAGGVRRMFHHGAE